MLHHTRGSPDHIVSRQLAINVQGQFDVAVARREFELHLLNPVALVEIQKTFPRCAVLFADKDYDSGVLKQLLVERVAFVLDLASVGVLGLPRDTSFFIGHEVMSDRDPILCPDTIVGANFVILKLSAAGCPNPDFGHSHQPWRPVQLPLGQYNSFGIDYGRTDTQAFSAMVSSNLNGSTSMMYYNWWK